MIGLNERKLLLFVELKMLALLLRCCALNVTKIPYSHSEAKFKGTFVKMTRMTRKLGSISFSEAENHLRPVK